MRPILPIAAAAILLAPMVLANEWSQHGGDPTHQSAVPPGTNPDFGPFVQKWWGNLSVPGPVGSMAARDGLVYLGDREGTLWALDEENGGVLWSVDTGTSPIRSTPAVGPNNVYIISEDGKLHAYNRKTADKVPNYPIPIGPTKSSILLDQDTLYIGTQKGEVSRYFAQTGEKRWTFKATGNHHGVQCEAGSVEGTPAIFGRIVLFGTTGRCFFGINVQLSQAELDAKCEITDDGLCGSEWVFKTDDAVRAPPAVDLGFAPERVLFCDVGGVCYAVNLHEQGKVFTPSWRHREGTVNGILPQFLAGPAIYDGKGIFVHNLGVVIALNLNGGGAELWRANVGGSVIGNPAISNGWVLVVSLNKNAYMLRLSDGSFYDAYYEWSALGEIRTSPAIIDTQAFWADEDGALYSWGGQKPPRADLEVRSVGAALVTGRESVITVVVRNIGQLASPATTVTISVDGQLVDEPTVPPLEPTEEATITGRYTPPDAKAKEVTAFVDPARAIKEGSEQNNEATTTATPGAAAAPPPPPGAAPPAAPPAGTPEETPGAGILAFALALGVAAVARRRR